MLQLHYQSINIDSSNQGFPNLNFLGEGQWEKHPVLREHPQRATPETCDLCDIWSGLWGDMIGPTQRQIQRHWENTLKEWPKRIITFIVTLQLRVTGASIRNSYDVYQYDVPQIYLSFRVFCQKRCRYQCHKKTLLPNMQICKYGQICPAESEVSQRRRRVLGESFS